jgi:hypothetical protein
VRKLGVLLAVASVVAGLAAVSSAALPAGRFGEPAPASFRLADGSAGCRFFASGEIACRAAGTASSLVLEPDGNSLIAHRDVAWTVDTPVLGESESWWNGSVSCRVAHGVIACSTIAGGTVEVGATRIAATPPSTTA